LLDENDMNYSQTAREGGVSRQNIYNWKKQYWEDYLIQKSKVKDQVHDVQAIKLSTVEEFNKIKDQLSDLMKLTIKRTKEILDDPENLERLHPSILNNLAQLIKVTAPYCAEKMGVMGTEDPENNTIGANHFGAGLKRYHLPV
jgi:hypothetical protein